MAGEAEVEPMTLMLSSSLSFFLASEESAGVMTAGIPEVDGPLPVCMVGVFGWGFCFGLVLVLLMILGVELGLLLLGLLLEEFDFLLVLKLFLEPLTLSDSTSSSLVSTSIISSTPDSNMSLLDSLKLLLLSTSCRKGHSLPFLGVQPFPV